MPFSIAITSLGEERASLGAFRMFVRFALVWFCLFPLPLGVWEGLRFVIVAVTGLFSYPFFSTYRSKAVVPVLVLLFVALFFVVVFFFCCVFLFFFFFTRRFVLCLTLCYFVLVFFSPFSIAITSLVEESANISDFRTFVRFALVLFCLFPLPLGVWEGLRFVIVALLGIFSYLFLLHNC